MNTNRLIIYILCLILLTACGQNKKEQEEAWNACTSVNGVPTGNRISGMVYQLDTIYEGQLRDEFTSREYGPGIYGYTYITEEYANLTRDLSEASAVLCAEVTTPFYHSCNYPSDTKIYFTLKQYTTEARLTLLAWPSKELIAQTTLENKNVDHCPTNIVHESDEKSRNSYAPVDLKGWLDQYITTTK